MTLLLTELGEVAGVNVEIHLAYWESTVRKTGGYQ